MLNRKLNGVLDSRNNIWNQFGTWNGVTEGVRLDMNRNKLLSFDLDVRENESGYTVFIDLPGVNKNDIVVTIENEVLNITANRKENVNVDNGRYTLCERSYGKISRSVQLDGAVDDGVEAKYVDGVLTVNVPRIKRNNSRKTITIL